MNSKQEIIEALNSLCIEPEKAIIEDTERSLVIDTFKKRFIKGNPSQYWLSFSRPFISLQYEGLEDVNKVITSSFGESSTIYLLAENDFLIQISSDQVIKLLAECSFFEYYLFDKDCTQTLCETDHNELLYVDANNAIFQEGL